MTTNQILSKANEVVRNSNFTKLSKARKNAGHCFLICACGNGLAFYGSFSSEAVYCIYNDLVMKLS